MKILVTGGTGYIGSHTTVELIRAGHEVEILDNLFNSKIEVLDKIEKITGVKPKFYKVDLLDYPTTLDVLKNAGFEAVIHFAGMKAVGESVEKPLTYYENNIQGTVNLLKAMREAEVKKLVFSSSATVYGDKGADSARLVETMTTGVGVTNPYGWTKAMIEQIIKDVCVADPKFEATILRYFNPVGADKSGLIGEDPNGIPNNLMPIVTKVYQGKIDKLVIYGDDYETEDGSCERDFIHVTDLAKGHLAALEHSCPGVSIYNLGSGKATSVFEIVAAFEKLAGQELPKEIGARRAGDLAVVCANPALAWEKLGWKTELTIEDAIADTLRYLKNLE
ncbi:UDP-glucose 4-epimerase GalE [Candidatus Saccharibacteria bacterium]|nr:UDP-glucose 4-epimerase GalE [Candidatus Saccharibacteria bacterium]MBR6122944.1 UDP-glucose 4-epimerase GalE [Candidatus Saccharibacteria bacterium]